MAFRVEISDRAAADAAEAFAWLAEHSFEAAQRWYRALWEAIETLEAFPARCPLAPESELVSAEVRCLLVGNRPHVYRVLFVIEGNTVTVLHVLHGARDTT